MPGMLHGRVVRPPAIGAKLESVDESSVKDIPGIVKVVREGNFLGVVARKRMGRDRGARSAQGHLVEIGDAARTGEAVGARARHQGRQGRVTSNVGNTAEAHGEGRRQEHQGDLRLRHPHPRLDRAVLRGRRVQGRQADLLVGLAGDPRSAQAARADVRICRSRTCAASMSKAPAATAATATRTPPPTRRCSPRRSASRCACNGRAPTSMAGIPKGPPTLIDLRASDGLPPATSRPGNREFFIPQQTPGGFLVPLVAATLAGMPADDHIAPGNIFQNSAIRYKFPNIKIRLPPAGDDAVPPVLDQDAGAHAEHLRQRMLHGRARGGGQGRSDRVPPEVSRPRTTSAASKCSTAWRRSPSGRSARRRRRRRAATSSRAAACSYVKYELVRTYVGAVAEVEVDRTTGVIRVREVHRRPRLRPDHQSGRPEEPDRGQRHPDRQPHADRGGEVRPLAGDQPRLGELSDPHLPGGAGDRHRADRPADRKAVGRRRARRRGGAVGDLERGVRRDRRAAALDALTRPTR